MSNLLRRWIGRGGDVPEELPLSVQKAITNEQVITALAFQLPLFCLKSFRKVSSHWEFAARPAYYLKSKVHFYSIRDVERYLPTQEWIHSSYSLHFYLVPVNPDHLGRFQNHQNLPVALYGPPDHQHHHHHHHQLQAPEGENPHEESTRTTLETFFTRFGNQITRLNLYLTWEEPQNLIHTWTMFTQLKGLVELEVKIVIARLLGPNTWILPHDGWLENMVSPSVKKLKMEWRVICAHPDHEWEFAQDTPLVDLKPLALMIIKTFPKVQELTLDDAYCRRNSHSNFQESFFQELKRKRTHFPDLEKLHMCANKGTPPLLAQMDHLRLKSLSLFFNSELDEASNQAMTKILQDQAGTLESLRLILVPSTVGVIEDDARALELNFPRVMPHLKSLKLLFNFKTPVLKKLRMTFPRVWDYGRKFPHLSSLVVNSLVNTSYRSSIPQDQVGITHTATPEEIVREKILSKFIPKLPKARMNGGLKSLRMQFSPPVEMDRNGREIPMRADVRRKVDEVSGRVGVIFPDATVDDDVDKDDWRFMSQNRTTDGVNHVDWTKVNHRTSFWQL